MRRFSLPLLTTLALLGCGGASPSEPELAAEQQFRATASVHLADGAQSGRGPALVASVVISSLQFSPVRLTINHQCPVALRLYHPDSADTVPVYDEGNRGCSRIGELVEVPPMGSHELTHELSLRDLDEAGVGPGKYVVRALVVATEAMGGPGPFTVPAGEVEIP